MSKLLYSQFEFSQKISLLIIIAQHLGYNVSVGDAYRDDRVKYGHKKSTHRKRLAEDINLFIGKEWLNGDDARTKKAFNRLHDHWDLLGGSKRIKADLNHFSIEWDGVR